MISLKGSMFYVSCEDYSSKVFVYNGKEFEEVTSNLSEDEKDTLIDDLIYAISDLVKNQAQEKQQNNEKAITINLSESDLKRINDILGTTSYDDICTAYTEAMDIMLEKEKEFKEQEEGIYHDDDDEQDQSY